MNQLTTIFKVLSDESRLRMLLVLFQEDLCVCEICGILNIPQSRASKNLAKLRDLNLVTDERREKFVFYTLKRDHLLLMQTLREILDHKEAYPLIKTDATRLKDKDKYLNQCLLISDTE